MHLLACLFARACAWIPGSRDWWVGGGPLTEPFALPSVWLTAPLLRARKTIFTLYIAPLLATRDINDAWQQTFIRILQVVIKVYSSSASASHGGPAGPPPGLFTSRRSAPWPHFIVWPSARHLFVHCLLHTMSQYSSSSIKLKATIKRDINVQEWAAAFILCLCLFVDSPPNHRRPSVSLSRWPSCGDSGLALCCARKNVSLHYSTH